MLSVQKLQRIHLPRGRWLVVTALGVFGVVAMIFVYLTIRWTAVTNAQYGFSMPIPPRWTSSAYDYTVQQGKPCDYVVNLSPFGSSLPPTNTLQAQPPEYVQMVMPESCPKWSVQQEPQYKKIGTTTINGTTATLYGYEVPGAGGEFHRLAVATFGGHQYLFFFEYDYSSVTPQDNTNQELAVYNDILSHFSWSAPSK